MRADEAPGETQQTRRAAEILAHVDGVAEEKQSPFARFGINKRHGLAYRHSLKLGEHPVELRVHGPVQRRKSFGLGFQIRF